MRNRWFHSRVREKGHREEIRSGQTILPDAFSSPSSSQGCIQDTSHVPQTPSTLFMPQRNRNRDCIHGARRTSDVRCESPFVVVLVALYIIQMDNKLAQHRTVSPSRPHPYLQVLLFRPHAPLSRCLLQEAAHTVSWTTPTCSLAPGP